jgi:hypothetical protein
MAIITWTGLSDGTTWHDDGNWDLNTPTASDDVIVAGTFDLDTITNGPGDWAECKSIDMSDYTGIVTGNLFVGGDVTLSVGTNMTYGVSVIGDGTVDLAGATLNYLEIGQVSPGSYIASVTMASDVENMEAFVINDGSTFDLGTNSIIVPLLNYGSGATFNWSSGATLTLTHGHEFDVTSTINGTDQLPPVTLNATGAGLIIINGVFTSPSVTLVGGSVATSDITTTGDVTLNGGSLSISTTLTVGGNFETNGVDLSNFNLIVSGTNFAHDCTITNVIATGGTKLDAEDNCVNGGGNFNADFVTGNVTTWTGLAGDGGQPTNPDNWDNGVPNSTLNVVVTGNGSFGDSWTFECNNFDCSGFTGVFTAINMTAYGDTIRLSSAITSATLSYDVSITYINPCSLYSNGCTVSRINFNAEAPALMELMDDITVLEGVHCDIDLNGNTLTFKDDGDAEGLDNASLNNGYLHIDAASTFVVGANVNLDGTHVIHTGLPLYIVGASCLSWTSYSDILDMTTLVASESVTLSGNVGCEPAPATNITCNGNLYIGNVTSADGPSITVGGNAFIGGAGLVSESGSLIVAVSGNLSASNAAWLNGSISVSGDALFTTGGLNLNASGTISIGGDLTANTIVTLGPSDIVGGNLTVQNDFYSIGGTILGNVDAGILHIADVGLTVGGNLTADSGSMEVPNGFTLTVSGNASIPDVVMSGTFSPVYVNIVGSASLIGSFTKVISVGSTIQAGPTSIDGGENDNINFSSLITYGPNVAPTGMTSNAGPGAIAFGTNGSLPWKLFDGDDTTTYSYAQNSLPHIFGVQLEQARTVAKMRYRTYVDVNYVPKDFTFEGSNDGETYTTLLTVVDAPNNSNSWEEYEFENSTAYTYYRIVQTAGYGGAQELALFTLEMFEVAQENVNLIPVMTSNTAPSGVASANDDFSGANPAWMAFDGDDATYWYGYPTINSGWIQYQFVSPVIVQSIKILGFAASQVGYYPADWTFEGSNDGSNWDILDTRTGMGTDDDDQLHEYSFVNSTQYLYYKLNITAVNLSFRAPVIKTLEMYGQPGEGGGPNLLQIAKIKTRGFFNGE